MANKLYLDNAYLQSCTSNVIERKEVNGKPAVILDRTIFYPTSGGQPHDTGTINNVAVIDVFEDKNGQIVHVLEKPVADGQVACEINWQRRFDNMQQHTGQHILSQALLKVCKGDTLSFHLGDRSATIDIDQSGLSSEIIESVEQLANQTVFENRDVTGRIVDRDEIHQYPVRKLPTVQENIRILEIKDFDYSPCGGTHCSKTGEIGLIKIRHYENYKGGTRIHFVCGHRALQDYQGKTEILKQLTHAMSVAEADLPRNITKIKDDLKVLTRERDQLKKELLGYEAVSLFSEAKKHASIHLIKRIFNARHQKEIKWLAKNIVDQFPDTVILFGIRSEDNAQLLFQCTENLNFDMSRLMQAACAMINGRGGGRLQQAQGGGPEIDKLEDALQWAEDQIIERINSR